MSDSVPERLAPRGALPPDCAAYRTIGPFDAASLPQGLRSEHSLKPGVWGVLSLVEGAIGFVWADGEGGREELTAPVDLVVPPQVLHHVEANQPFVLSIAFHRA